MAVEATSIHPSIHPGERSETQTVTPCRLAHPTHAVGPDATPRGAVSDLLSALVPQPRTSPWRAASLDGGPPRSLSAPRPRPRPEAHAAPEHGE